MSERDVFIAALQEEDPAQRLAYLNETCAGQPELRRQVEDLLRLHEAAGSFLHSPAVGSAVPGGFDGTPERPASPESPGAVIGPYKLLQQVGEGGMGTVWMAQQNEPVKRLVALKIIQPGLDGKQVLARFEAERQALALMDHPNIAKVLDAGATESGRPYFVMELVKGVPLTEYCDANHLSTRARLELFLPVCQAVQHAHTKGVIHRDLKPGNVLVAPYDGVPVPKVIDFGVAKAAGQPLTEKTLVTGFGAVVGTPEYMSPEQAELNNQDIDTRSDIYSLGVLLYELLTGTTPLTRQRVKSAALLEVLRLVRDEEPPKPSTRLSESKEALPSISAQRRTEPARLTKLVRGELDWIVMKALEKDRNRRYETANGLAMDLRRHLADEPVVARPPSRAYLLRKFAQRNRGPVLSAVLVLLALLGGVVGTTWGMVRAERARRAAVLAELAEAQRARGERRAREDAQKRLAQVEKATEILAAVFRDLDPEAEERAGVGLRALVARRMNEAAQQLEGDAVGDPLAVARLQHVLGVSLRDLGDLELAERVLAKACQTRSQLLGPDHLDAAASKHYLAMVYRTQAKYAAAEQLYKEVLDIRTAKLGQDHPDTLDSRQQLALLYHAQGRFDLAWSLCKQVLERRAAVLGPDHPDTLTTEHRLAMVYRSQGRFDLAESLGKDVLERRSATLGADDLDTLASKQLLAVLYHSQGKHALAEALYKEVLEFRTAKLGADHPDTFGTRHHLALVYRSMHKFDLSVPLLEETLNLRTAKLGPDHPDTLRTKADLGACYYEAGRFADAIAFLTDPRGRTGGGDPQVPENTQAALGQALERLAKLYDAAGRPAAAAEWRAEWRKIIPERDTGAEP